MRTVTLFHYHGNSGTRSRRREFLLLLCAAATLCFAAAAVASILLGPYWFEMVYPTTAVWLWLPLVLGLRHAMVR